MPGFSPPAKFSLGDVELDPVTLLKLEALAKHEYRTVPEQVARCVEVHVNGHLPPELRRKIPEKNGGEGAD